ncbi:ankyrin repeat domain-containing protein [Nocardia iowensis]|uniref:Ankyrin repeat domain-containing protein n=1 Tax=Nocardia iowensis TaxID=204891 RepID=A0ABX8RP59_NOCIO|nr:ankyrin repeat domain-containing protein [Nocardia iowensis]QXN91378.1 ankyrin repeat domain-containing protein [Nocardia iowensis]
MVKDDVGKVNKLLAKGADLRGVGICGWNVLMLALAARKRKAFRALLDAGVDTTHRDEDGATVLHIAARIEDAWYMQTLLEYPVDVNAIDPSSGATPLVAARGNYEQFQMLLAAGADPNIPDLSGGTALHHAAELARYQQVLDLLNAGADPNRADESGRTFQGYLHRPDPLDQGTEMRTKRAQITAWLRDHGIPIEQVPEHIARARAAGARHRAVGHVGDGAGGWTPAFTIDSSEFDDFIEFGKAIESALNELQQHNIPAKVVQRRYPAGDPIFSLPSWEEYRSR